MTPNEALDFYLSSLPRHARIAKARDIREYLGISKCVLSNWRRGRSKLKRIYLDKIMEVLDVDLNSIVEK